MRVDLVNLQSRGEFLLQVGEISFNSLHIKEPLNAHWGNDSPFGTVFDIKTLQLKPTLSVQY